MASRTKAQRKRHAAKRDQTRFGERLDCSVHPVVIGIDKAECCDCSYFSLSDLTLGSWDRLHFRAEGHALLESHAVALYRAWQQPGDDPIEVVTKETRV